MTSGLPANTTSVTYAYMCYPLLIVVSCGITVSLGGVLDPQLQYLFGNNTGDAVTLRVTDTNYVTHDHVLADLSDSYVTTNIISWQTDVNECTSDPITIYSVPFCEPQILNPTLNYQIQNDFFNPNISYTVISDIGPSYFLTIPIGETSDILSNVTSIQIPC